MGDDGDDGDDGDGGDDGDDDDMCIVCMERERSVVLMPCRHIVMCAECGHHVVSLKNGCPMCRQEICSHIVIES